jgi:hypothetical protein
MEKKPHHHQADFDALSKRISDLEKRVTLLEVSGSTDVRENYRFFTPAGKKDHLAERGTPRQNESVESRIGEYGMAWLGNIVLLFGILFLSQLLNKNEQKLFSLLLGIISVAGIYFAGNYTKESFPYMSRLFHFNGHILLFITSMRIYILKGSRITDIPFLGYAAVLIVLIILIYLGFKRKSQLLVLIVWLMTTVTAIASNSTHLMLSLTVGITGTAVLLALRNGWWTGLIVSVILVYFIFLVWIAGNPIMNGSVGIISEHQYGYIYLFTCALLFSLLGLTPESEEVPVNFIHGAIILNGIGFSFILALAVLAFFTSNYFLYFGMIAAFCMGYSIWLQSRGNWKTIAAMYAIYSFVALSITIGGIYKFPLAFFLLSIQSLLVVSMALWFRSRFIVIMNTLLFSGLLLVYLATSDSLASINFAFALVALATARVMNWKKKRLEIRTELIRNIYLFAGASMVLYSLHEAVPPHFVTLSWALSAMLFFILSVLIRNIKYRWLAIFTMIVTVFYLFIVDLKNIGLGYRIVALLFISIISLSISLFYTRRIKSKENTHEQST